MQRYRLRLGDGTILHVDRATLGTWSIDERAMVQTVGSQRWQPLQQFLAHERALTRQMSAEEPGPTGSADLAEGPPQPSVVVGSTGLREKLLGSRAARALLGTASRFGGFLGLFVDRVERLEERLSRVEREGGGQAPPTPRPASVVEGGLPRVAAKLRLLAVRAWGRGADLLGSLGLVNRPSPPAVPRPSASPDRLADPSPPAASGLPPVATPPGLDPPAPHDPPAIGALPVLRLAPISEPVEETEGDARVGRKAAGSLDGAIGVVRGAWPHARRYLAVATLVAAGVWAVLAREAWLPAVTRHGRTIFTEIDGRVRERHQAAANEEALREATRQIPHLTPATVELVLTGSPTGMLGPAEVFRLAREAADRGSAALTADERRDLARLRRDLLQTLSPVERGELRDYDRALEQRASFAFEDEEALRLFARGARALPPGKLERLQELYGKAVGAGFTPGEAPTEPSETPAAR